MKTAIFQFVLVATIATVISCSREPAPAPAAPDAPDAPGAPDKPAGRLYVTNENSGDLSVIDTATRTVIATIPLGKRPRGIKVSPDGATLYVALSGSPMAPPGTDESKLPPPDRKADGIGVVDVKQGKLLRVIQGGSDPEQTAISQDGRWLFVANEDAGQTSVIEISNGRVVATVPVGGEPEGVDLRPDGKVVYVTSEEDNQVAVIDAATAQLVTTFKAGPRPRATGFLPDSSRAYVTAETGAAVVVVDAQAHKPLETIKLEGGDLVRPMGVVSSGDGKHVFVTTGRGKNVVIIDTATNTVTGTVEVGERPWGIAATRDGRMVFTANGPSNDVSFVDIPNRKVIATVKVGDRPWGLVYLEGAR
jgi:YVTN family beta-propeller protein